MTINQVSKGDYNVMDYGKDPKARELMWYAIEDNSAIGVVIENPEEKTFDWVMFLQDDTIGPGYSAIDIGTSIETEDEATLILHRAMETSRL